MTICPSATPSQYSIITIPPLSFGTEYSMESLPFIFPFSTFTTESPAELLSLSPSVKWYRLVLYASFVNGASDVISVSDRSISSDPASWRSLLRQNFSPTARSADAVGAFPA